ncbi:hypothetical protein ANAPC3_01370 [Anaplasma phagocytophilum]|nr:hypothetical protein ANAPC3_01370 [Anaplasma phagocytophilum]
MRALYILSGYGEFYPCCMESFYALFFILVFYVILKLRVCSLVLEDDIKVVGERGFRKPLLLVPVLSVFRTL